MRLLATVAILLLAQEPPPDDVGPKFHPPLAPDREWEMAAAYYGKIGDALKAKDYDTARAWDRRARDRVAEPYRQLLEEKGREFWGDLRGLPANRASVEYKALKCAIALGAGTGADIDEIRKRKAAAGLKESSYHYELAVVLTKACEGDYGAANRLLDQVAAGNTGEWESKNIADVRAQFEKGADSAGDVSRCTEYARRVTGTAQGPAFATLQRINRNLGSSPDAEGRQSLIKGAVELMKYLRDAAGAKAWEDRLIRDPATPAGESRDLIARRASAALEKGDFNETERICRDLLKRWPTDPEVDQTLYFLGRALKGQAKYGEARAVFDDLVEMKDPGPSDRRRRVSYQRFARFEIGSCFEAEENWKKALTAYLECPEVPRERGPHSPRLDFAIPEAILRCRLKLKQFEEALKDCREHVYSEGRCHPPIVVRYIDLAVTQGKVAEEERRLRAAPENRSVVGVKMAQDYLRVLKLRSARDAAGLFAMVTNESLPLNIHYVRQWGDLRSEGSWLAVEALEALAELGDAAIDHLVPIAKLGVDRAHVALVALGRVRNQRARDLIAKLDWVEGHLPHSWGQTYRKLADDPPLPRARLPEMPAAAPDPREVAKRQEAAAAYRKLLPELTGKLKGIDELLALETDAARFQALGDTILAWKKGLIVDEDLQDLVDHAIETKWSLEPKPLVALIQEHRAAPAAPLAEAALASEDASVRREAVQLLGAFKYRKAIPAIVKLLKDPDADVVVRALNSLAWLEAKEEIPTIAEFLRLSDQPHRITHAIGALGRLGALNHAGQIAVYLKDPDPSCRASAAEALGRLKARDFAAQIKPLLEDKVEWVRTKAAEALKILEK